LLAAAGAPAMTKPFLGRGVRITTKQDFIFAKGMVAKNKIDLNGNNIETDSFDSSDPNFSTGGFYDKNKAKDNGDIATNSSLTNSLNIGNANIRGKVGTGPNGSASIGPNGTVGSKNWVDAGKKGFEPGSRRDDMNVDFKDVPVPFNGGAFTPFGGWVNNVYYKYIVLNGNWQLTDFKLTGSEKMRVLGKAVLYVTQDFDMTGNTQIEISPGASLKLFVGASSASIGGNGVANATGLASSFAYLGLPSNKTLTYSGNAAFTGTVYAPDADFNLNGGGHGPYDFVGASVTKTVRMNGHFKFHYDEALGKYGPIRGFVVNSWNEMNPQEVSSIPGVDCGPSGVIY